MVVETNARPFSFDRVQEITDYISSRITWVSKLPGFGGAGGRGGDTALQTQYRLGLIIVDATEEEAAYIIFVLLWPSCFCSPG